MRLKILRWKIMEYKIIWRKSIPFLTNDTLWIKKSLICEYSHNKAIFTRVILLIIFHGTLWWLRFCFCIGLFCLLLWYHSRLQDDPDGLIEHRLQVRLSHGRTLDVLTTHLLNDSLSLSIKIFTLQSEIARKGSRHLTSSSLFCFRQISWVRWAFGCVAPGTIS